MFIFSNYIDLSKAFLVTLNCISYRNLSKLGYIEGGEIGFLAVVCAFFGGLLILLHPLIGIIFVLAGVWLGDSV